MTAIRNLNMTAAEAPRQSNFFEFCSKCTTNYGCCQGTRPPITQARKRIIENYLKQENVIAKRPFAEDYYIFPREAEGGYCVFHNLRTRKCLIHVVKPETCVAGPITFDVDKVTGEIQWFIKMEEICPLAGAVFSDKKMLARHLKTAKREITRLIADLEPEELKAILKKDEPETIRLRPK